MTEQPPPPRRTTANWVLAGLIGAFGLVVFWGTVRDGRADSALLFVALPVLLAAALALTPGRTSHGRVFVVTTIALLLASVALHEGAICVIMVAPLVYAIAHGTMALINLVARSSRTYSFLLVPLLLLPGLEGSGIGPRIVPDQSIEVVRIVALSADAVAERLAAGPSPTPVRSPALRVLGVPVPAHVAGAGLAPGDRWAFGYHGSAHGPGGHLVAEVETSEPRRLTFRFPEDTTINGRWFRWQHAELSWQAVDADRTEVRLTIDYRRGLDPSWYFGPLQDALLDQGGGHLLDMLALR